MDNISFSYMDDAPLLKGINFQFEQGKLYTLVGHPHQGRATLMKILGQVVVPQEGTIFVPPHLRVLHVSRECFILNASFIENVIFNQSMAKLGGWERVRSVCTRC